MIVCALVPLFYAYQMVSPELMFYNYVWEMYTVVIMCSFGCTSQVSSSGLKINKSFLYDKK